MVKNASTSLGSSVRKFSSAAKVLRLCRYPMVGGNDSNSLQLTSNSSNRDRLCERNRGRKVETQKMTEKKEGREGEGIILMQNLFYSLKLQYAFKGGGWCVSVFTLVNKSWGKKNTKPGVKLSDYQVKICKSRIQYLPLCKLLLKAEEKREIM